MPTYDYQCSECGQVMEISHSIHDNAVEYYNHTKGEDEEPCEGKLKRLISSTYFTFKNGPPTPKTYV
jgi:predicted nucleic acid-binding Zn ribbon protein